MNPARPVRPHRRARTAAVLPALAPAVLSACSCAEERPAERRILRARGLAVGP